jgi:hypothetical protein
MTGGARPELSEHAKRVLNGYANLTAEEREQLKARIAEIDRGPDSENRILTEEFKGLRATLGPKAPGCPCCGR